MSLKGPPILHGRGLHSPGSDRVVCRDSLVVLGPSRGLPTRAEADIRQTAGAWAWWEQAGTRQCDATGSPKRLLFWDRLVEDVIKQNAGQGWPASFGCLPLGALACRGLLLHAYFNHWTAVSGLCLKLMSQVEVYLSSCVGASLEPSLPPPAFLCLHYGLTPFLHWSTLPPPSGYLSLLLRIVASQPSPPHLLSPLPCSHAHFTMLCSHLVQGSWLRRGSGFFSVEKNFL